MTASGGHRRALLAFAGLVGGSLGLLLLALATSAVLTFSALERAQMDLLSEEYELAGREAAAQIEAGLRFGRPLEQFLGLEEILDGLRDLPGVIEAGVTDATGMPLAGLAGPEMGNTLARSVATMARQTTATVAERRLFLTALRSASGDAAGALVIVVPIAELHAARDRAVTDGLAAMLTISAVAASILALWAGRLRRGMSRGLAVRRGWVLLPVSVLLTAQIAYAAFVLHSFSIDLTAATQTAAQRVAERAGADLARLLALGLDFDRMPGLDAQLAGMLDLSGAVDRIVVLDAQSAPLFVIDQPGDGLSGLARLLPVPDAGTLRLALEYRDGRPAGYLTAAVSPAPIAIGLADQLVELLTVAATSAFVMIELLILMQVLLERMGGRGTPPGGPPPSAATRADTPARPATQRESRPDLAAAHILGRPVMFAFVLAWALPLSFLPLKMRALGEDLWGLPADMVLALPISAEMGCALVMAIVAGRLADRMGWAVPFVAGLLLSAIGGLAAALAPDGASFVVARGVTGMGYGLAWMALQFFAIEAGGPARRGQALANLMAGILAGFIAGTALGGILSDRLGYDQVLMASGLLVAAPLGIALLALRSFMFINRPGPAAQAGSGPVGPTGAPRPEPRARSGWRGLVRSPEYLGMLLLSVVPFSIAQVGLLYFAVPLHLDAAGGSPADTGRILMVYGIIVILLGPPLSRVIDRSRRKAPIVVLGGLIGGIGLALLHVGAGLGGLFLAAGMLSLSSVLIEPARAAFILELRAVRQAGQASALGWQRAADKLGQMIGPLVIALAFASSGVIERVALLGLGFAAASLALALVILLTARSRRRNSEGRELHHD